MICLKLIQFQFKYNLNDIVVFPNFQLSLTNLPDCPFLFDKPRPEEGIVSHLSHLCLVASPPPLNSTAVLHDNKLTHTDLKPENILFVNSDFSLEYNTAKVSVNGRRKGEKCMMGGIFTDEVNQ